MTAYEVSSHYHLVSCVVVSDSGVAFLDWISSVLLPKKNFCYCTFYVHCRLVVHLPCWRMWQKVKSWSFLCTSTRVYSLGFRSRGSLGNQLLTSSDLPRSMQNGAIHETWFIPCVYVAWETRRVCNNQESNLPLCCRVSCFVNFVCL